MSFVSHTEASAPHPQSRNGIIHPACTGHSKEELGLDAASEPGKTSHNSLLFSFLLSSSTGAHLRQQNTGHLQLLVGSGFRTWNSEQKSHTAMAEGERRQKNTLILPRGPWLGPSSAANYCRVKSLWIPEHSSLPATPTPGGTWGRIPVQLSFTSARGKDTAEFALGPPVLDMSDKGEQALLGPGSPS